MRYHLTTFGCQMNEHDSERMKGLLESLGYAPSDTRDDADLIVFNTCTIRASADERFFGNLGDARRIKRERPDVVVAVGGCWAQSQKQQVFEQFPFVDIAFGPGEVRRLGELVARERIQSVGAFSFDGAFSAPCRPARAAAPGLGADLGRMQLRRARTASCRASGAGSAAAPWPTARRRSARSPPTACARSRCSGRTSTSYGRDLRGEERADFAALLRAVGAHRRASSGSATPAPTPRT